MVRLGSLDRKNLGMVQISDKLAWAVKLKNDVPFCGRDALWEQQNHALKKRLVGFTVNDSQVVLLGRETIYRDGERVGWLSSAGWGYTVQKNIGYGYVRHPEGVNGEWLESGSYELEVAGERVATTLQIKPPYDPASTRVRS